MREILKNLAIDAIVLIVIIAPLPISIMAYISYKINLAECVFGCLSGVAIIHFVIVGKLMYNEYKEGKLWR